ncbi:MAG: NAD(P)H-hydrate dehydratase, partial [Lachnospiraceae bacterium]|nr:NAD(P)H-hydrate dehydratase [Lachnospiraceae bacterium]
MRALLDARQSKEVDDYAIGIIGMHSPVLMEKAALSCVSALDMQDGEKLVSICGSGNNGGDGIAIARILFNEGFETAVILTSDPEKMSEGCREQFYIAEKLGMQIYMYDDLTEEGGAEGFLSFLNEYDVIVDAVFGTGLSRDVNDRYRAMFECINEADAYILSVDVPSGINASDGRLMGSAVTADMTVTMGYDKIGLCMYPGRFYAGEKIIADIGFPYDSLSEVSGKIVYMTDANDKFPILIGRDPEGNKGTFGHTLVIAGSKGMAGAAFLCALSAYRAGTGLVRILTEESNREVLQTLIPEAIVDTYDGEQPDLAFIAEKLKWADSVAIGPGIGTSDTAAAILNKVLTSYKGQLTLDADALNLISRKKTLLKKLKDRAVITPHVGEMARLTGRSIEDIKADTIGAAAAFSDQYGLCCVLKDAISVIAMDGGVWLSESGCDGMATGGSGDVLTGVIAGLIAQGYDTGAAVRAAVYAHGEAGTLASEEKGAHAV